MIPSMPFTAPWNSVSTGLTLPPSTVWDILKKWWRAP